ncbi:MAG: hypothetical protein WCJ14_13975, partial [Verrucomicrobiota bacterium]
LIIRAQTPRCNSDFLTAGVHLSTFQSNKPPPDYVPANMKELCLLIIISLAFASLLAADTCKEVVRDASGRVVQTIERQKGPSGAVQPASFLRRTRQASDHLLAIERPRLVGELLPCRRQGLHVGPVLLSDPQCVVHVLRVERVLSRHPGGSRENLRVDQRKRQSHEILAGGCWT